MLAQQYTLFGGTGAQGDIVAKVRAILEDDESTRDSYAELVAAFWFQYDGLGDVIPLEYHTAFTEWLHKATSWKTIQNRAGEIQRNNPHLDSSPDVREKRNRQARQGVVR